MNEYNAIVQCRPTRRPTISHLLDHYPETFKLH